MIWNPGALPIRKKWFEDGPVLPIEFARQSKDGRITLVIAETESLVRSLWALMTIDDLASAKSALAARESIQEADIKYSIGFWDKATNTSHGMGKAAIQAWAAEKDLDAAVWTNLKIGLVASRDHMPTYDQILASLQGLAHEKRAVAEEYVRHAPIQNGYRISEKTPT
ncbi:hypothetical protein JQK88_31930 [Mesorhizobium caraganae]|uniref:hypothetical protein n=1 Tax=Mesorhizobium caraganae TaxID=483206 RepID=UPI00193984CD|nr:hypothetical protein [Mesorhizobium caraganae]MBM2715726.1 hypothetical protein [Mesorhizobium caraganae]